MTWSSDLLRIAQIKTLFKDAINRLNPGSITNDTPFREYVDALNSYEVKPVTYIKAGGKIKTHIYKPEINQVFNMFDTQGSLTNNNYVYSGFSNSYFLYKNNSVARNLSTGEIILKFNTTSIGNNQCLYETGIYSTQYGWNIALTYDGHPRLWSGETGEVWGSTQLDVNTWYYFKCTIDIPNDLITLYSSTDGITWTEECHHTASVVNASNWGNSSQYIGRRGYNSSEYFAGSIDFKGVSISFNGTPSTYFIHQDYEEI